MRCRQTSLTEINYIGSQLQKLARFISEDLNWNDVRFELNDNAMMAHKEIIVEIESIRDIQINSL